MADTGKAIRGLVKESSRTELTPAERETGWFWRRICFGVLLCLSVLAIGGAAFWWQLWYATAESCLRVYILPEGTQVGNQQQRSLLGFLEDPASWRDCTWRDYFIALDITSFSSAILALLFTWVGYSGIRNTIWRWYREGKGFFDHAYDAGLFPKSFASVCIQFGLLGTLLSFLLAAVAQIGSAIPGAAGGGHASQFMEKTIADEVLAIAQDPSQQIAGGEVVSDTRRHRSRDGAVAPADRDLSSEVFLLLCASLVSTFVGAFVAYVVIPPLNLLNDCALGVLQVNPVDHDHVVDEFFRQIDRTSRRLNDFETATESLVDAAEGVQRFQMAAGEASGTFSTMMEQLGTTAKSVETSNKRSDSLIKQLVAFEHQSERVVADLKQFAIHFREPLQQISQAASRLSKAGDAGNRTFQELRGMMTDARKPLAAVTEIGDRMGEAMAEIRDSLQAIAGSGTVQSAGTVELANAFHSLQAVIQDLLHELAADAASSASVARTADSLSYAAGAECSPTDSAGLGPRPRWRTSAGRSGMIARAARRAALRRARTPWWRRTYHWLFGDRDGCCPGPSTAAKELPVNREENVP